MPVKKRLISRAVLETELSFTMRLIENHNFGYAKDNIAKILNRIEEYDIDGAIVNAEGT